MEIKDLEFKLRSLLESLKTEFQSVRGSRPSPRMVEDIKVDYFEQQLPIKALGSISINPPREIVISVWDKNAVNVVAKAIETSNLKVTANIEGNLIRINLPSLTDERKKELEKVAKKMTEDVKIRIRGIRDDVNKEIKTAEENKLFSEDVAFRKKEEVQKSVDKINVETDKLLNDKIREILS
ncbi:MAG: ribosome recycling factor [Parcubacteria group bacterium Athens0714_26]|nr:MAG: ribosome recycling factor [Parcubacteria group bacterium Athens1014_26]TSD03546.1 MAG: ribosome recycling factor [Parcubacteria group bacterium Athens0714_26]